jgi:hypothetical protein
MSCGFPAEPRQVRGHFGDKSRAHKGMALRGKESRGPRDSCISCQGWQDVVQICSSLLFHLYHRHHTPANVLGDYGAHFEGRGGSIMALACYS